MSWWIVGAEEYQVGRGSVEIHSVTNAWGLMAGPATHEASESSEASRSTVRVTQQPRGRHVTLSAHTRCFVGPIGSTLTADAVNVVQRHHVEVDAVAPKLERTRDATRTNDDVLVAERHDLRLGRRAARVQHEAEVAATGGLPRHRRGATREPMQQKRSHLDRLYLKS
eukprot:3691932-Prymnesium_polylepis.1